MNAKGSRKRATVLKAGGRKSMRGRTREVGFLRQGASHGITTYPESREVRGEWLIGTTVFSFIGHAAGATVEF